LSGTTSWDRRTVGPESVCREILGALLIHMEIEEVLFYPAVQNMKAELATGSC
jgi:hypothetical protein